MKLHGNARTCPHTRRLIVRRVEEERWTLAAAAEAAGVSVRTVSKWLACYRAEGEDGLLDRSSAPRSIPHRTSEERVQAIAALRRLRMTAAEIGECLRMPLSTVSAVLTRIGLGKRSRLEPPEPANRYERKRPGELLHIDVKKLGRIGRPGHRVNGDRSARSRGVGWEFVHICVDDATRLAYVEVLEDEKTDNGSCYRAVIHTLACQALRIKHLRTQPYRPRTNGKAERFIRTMLGGWAYGAIYASSEERRQALAGWLNFYNRRRPHGSLGHQPPLRRLEALTRNNVAGSYN